MASVITQFNEIAGGAAKDQQSGDAGFGIVDSAKACMHRSSGASDGHWSNRQRHRRQGWPDCVAKTFGHVFGAGAS